MITELKNIDIAELSNMYDRETKDSFISLYLNIDHLDNKFIEKRRKVCASVLKENRELSNNFKRTMGLIERYLDKENEEEGQRGLVIFASDVHKLFRTYKLGMPVDNLLIVDTSPYIRPLSRLKDEDETYGLVILDSHRAKIFIVSSNKIVEKKKRAEDIMNKHKKGGCSQARFQRLRKGAIKHFLGEVFEELERLSSRFEIDKFVIAGPGNAKMHFKSILSDRIRLLTLDTIDVDFDIVEGELISKAGEIISKDETESGLNNVNRLREEILRDGLAVYGLKEIGDAVKNGQVELLLVSEGLKTRGWKCERCKVANPGDVDKCPYCGSRTSEVDLIEEIIEFAERTDSKIDFVESNPILDELGGIGGLLRFRL